MHQEITISYNIMKNRKIRRKSFLRVFSAPKARLTLSSLNRLFDRYDPIPLFRQYLRTLPPLIYAPSDVPSLPPGPRDDSGTPNPIATTTPYRKRWRRGGRPRTRSPLLNFGTVPVGGEKYRERWNERCCMHARGETRGKKGSGITCGVRARINSHPAALLFTI